MARYDNNQIIDNEGEARRFKSNIYPPIEKKTTDIYIISRDGDRLDLLAHKYYKDQTLWWIIASANGLGGSGLIIPPARQIRIPSDVEKILGDYRELQESR